MRACIEFCLRRLIDWLPEQAHDRCPGGVSPPAGGVQPSGGPVEHDHLLGASEGVLPPPTLDSDAQSHHSTPHAAYQHGFLLPRRHAVELREHRPRQRLDGPGAWARHRRGRHRRRPLRCPRQVVSRVSRERSRARSAGCARMASQGATGGPEAGSGGVGPAGRWSPVVPGPTGVLGSPLSGRHARRQCVFHS